MQKNSGFSDIPFLLQSLKWSACDHANTLKYSIHNLKITLTFFSPEGTKKSADGNQSPEAVYRTYLRQHTIFQMSLP